MLLKQRQTQKLQWNNWIGNQSFANPNHVVTTQRNLNIYDVFCSYKNSQKAYICTVLDTCTYLNFAPKENETFVVSEEVAGSRKTYHISGGTFNFTAGAIRKFVIVNTPNATCKASTFNQCVGIYCSKKVVGVENAKAIASAGVYSGNLEYFHHEDLSKITEIGVYGFSAMASRQNVITIPENVTSIGMQAFFSIQNLSSVQLNDKVTTIDGYCFFMSSITSFHIPAQVTSLGAVAITGTYIPPANLTSDNTKYQVWNGAIVEYSDGNIIKILSASRLFYGVNGVLDLTLPIFSNITGVYNNVFNSCSLLTTLRLKDNLSFNTSCFANCTGLTEIYNYAPTPFNLTNSTVFSGVNKAIPLHVPIGTTALYRANTYWNEFTNIIDDL